MCLVMFGKASEKVKNKKKNNIKIFFCKRY